MKKRDYFLINMTSIRTGFPELFERIQSLKGRFEDKRVRTVESMETLTADALMITASDGRSIRMNSAYDPEHEAEVWSEGQDKPDAPVVLVFGLGQGSFARRIIATKAESARVLIYEPSPKVFFHVLHHFDITEFFSRKDVFVVAEGINEDLFPGIMEVILDPTSYEDYRIYLHPKMQDVFSDSRERFIRHFAVDGLSWMKNSIDTEAKALDDSVRNLLGNIRFLPENTVVPRLKNTFPADVPVLLVGAGPSLAGDIATLREYRDRYYLFAADSACSYLLENNVIPDAFISVEAGNLNLDLVRDDRIYDVPAFFKLNSYHRFVESHRAKKIFGYDADAFAVNFYDRFDVPKSEYRYGANTMTSGFSICDELGVQTVVLVGQDMCFSSTGETHVDDNRSGVLGEVPEITCQNNRGETVLTRPDWESFIRWYENAIFDCGMKSVINTAERGARIRGAEYKPLKEVLEECKTVKKSWEEVLQKTKHTFLKNKPDFSGLYKQYRDSLIRIRERLQTAEGVAWIHDYPIYDILRKYEIVNRKGNVRDSIKEGVENLISVMDEMIESLENDT